jgi:hypothetical protein
MPWVYDPVIGDPIAYGEGGKGPVRWAVGQQVRVMYPVICTICGKASGARDKHVGLVSVLHRRESAESPTEWVTYCPDHFDAAVKAGKV